MMVLSCTSVLFILFLNKKMLFILQALLVTIALLEHLRPSHAPLVTIALLYLLPSMHAVLGHIQECRLPLVLLVVPVDISLYQVSLLV
jgi:hypothetical protein